MQEPRGALAGHGAAASNAAAAVLGRVVEGDEAEEVLKRGRGRGINKGGDGECAGPARPRVSAHVVGRVREAPRGADCVGCLGGGGRWMGKGIEIESTPPQMGGEGEGGKEEEEGEREVE